MSNEIKNTESIEETLQHISALMEKMVSSRDDIDADLEWLENQTPIKRLLNQNKNKLKKEEIKKETFKYLGYFSDTMELLLDIDTIQFSEIDKLDAKISDIRSSLTEFYKAELDTKNQIGEIKIIQAKTLRSLKKCSLKLNKKIENISNFFLLLEEIKQDKYKDPNKLLETCNIIEEIDIDTLNDQRKMELLKNTLKNKSIINNDEVMISQVLNDVIDMDEKDMLSLYSIIDDDNASYPINILLETIKQTLNEQPENKSEFINNILETHEDEIASDNISYILFFDAFVKNKIEAEKRNQEIIDSLFGTSRIKEYATIIRKHQENLKSGDNCNREIFERCKNLYSYLKNQLKSGNLDVDVDMKEEFGFIFHPMAETVLADIETEEFDFQEFYCYDDILPWYTILEDYMENTTSFSNREQLENIFSIYKNISDIQADYHYSEKSIDPEKYKDMNPDKLKKLYEERIMAFVGALQELGNNNNASAFILLGKMYDPYHRNPQSKGFEFLRANENKSIDYYIRAALQGGKEAAEYLCELHESKKHCLTDDIYEDIRVAKTKKENIVKTNLEWFDVEKCMEVLIESTV